MQYCGLCALPAPGENVDSDDDDDSVDDDDEKHAVMTNDFSSMPSFGWCYFLSSSLNSVSFEWHRRQFVRCAAAACTSAASLSFVCHSHLSISSCR